MAIAVTQDTIFGQTVFRAQPLVNAVAITDGEWIDGSGLKGLSVHVFGITTATVEIDGSDSFPKPADNTHGVKLNTTDITANQIVQVNYTIRWLKVRVVAYTSGTINAFLQGHGGEM
jgi:hypothetical protein